MKIKRSPRKNVLVQRSGKRQAGVALVLAMLIVALVSAIAIEISWRFDLGATRSGNRFIGMQAAAYLDGVEALAKIMLREDAQNSEIDTLGEDWALDYPPLPTDAGWVQGKIEDAQGRFNLNLLAIKAKPPKNNVEQWQSFTASQRRFIRLLQVIPLQAAVAAGAEGATEQEETIDVQMAINITEAVIDWLDPDSNQTGYGGAESDYYSSLPMPFTIGNRLFASVSELRIIKGINELPNLYENLLPYIIALPPDDSGAIAKLNVNTAPVEILRTINDKRILRPLSLSEVQPIWDDRGDALGLAQGSTAQGNKEQGFADIGEFSSSYGVESAVGTDAAGKSNLDPEDLVFASSYFLFFGKTEVGERIQNSRSLLYRANDDVITLRRTDANF